MPESWGSRPTWMVDQQPDPDPSDVILIIFCAIVTGICLGLIWWKIWGGS